MRRQRAEPEKASGAPTGKMQTNDALIAFFATLLSSWRCERAVDGGQGGRWPEVKECKRGGAGQLHSCPRNRGVSIGVCKYRCCACLTPSWQKKEKVAGVHSGVSASAKVKRWHSEVTSVPCKHNPVRACVCVCVCVRVSHEASSWCLLARLHSLTRKLTLSPHLLSRHQLEGSVHGTGPFPLCACATQTHTHMLARMHMRAPAA